MKYWAILLSTLCACATASSDKDGDALNPDQNDESGADASSHNPDAQVKNPVADAQAFDAATTAIDAATLGDAGFSLDGGLLCKSNDECPPDQCCLAFGNAPGACLPGTRIGESCAPGN